MKFGTFVALCVVSGLLAAPAMADILPITFTSLGREDTNPLKLTYTKSTGLLSIVGTNTGVSVSTNGAATFTSYYGNFDLEAVINSSTGLATSASISLQIHSPFKASPLQTIWSSTNMTAFGSSPSLSELDFKFVQSGPSFLPDFHAGSEFEIEIFKLQQTPKTLPWSWSSTTFSGTVKNDGGGGTAAPAPNTAVAGAGLLALAGIGAVARRRRVLA